MKFRSIFSEFIICVLIIPNVYGGEGKLSTDENEERLASCGKIALPIPSSDATGKNTGEGFPWLYFTTFGQSYPTFFPSFPISHRHMFTSSQVILDEEMRFRDDNKSINDDLCGNPVMGFEHLDVPEKYLKNIMIFKVDKLYDHKFYSSKIREARLFSTCGMNNFDSEYSPLLLEIEEHKEKPVPPCSADKNTKFLVGDSVDSYGFHHGPMKHNKLQVSPKNQSTVVYNF